MPLQQDAGPYVPREHSSSMLARWRAESGKQSACHASSVVCDQARHRRRHGLGERRLAHEGAYQFAVFGLEHELKFGNRATEDDVMSGPYAFAMGGIELARVGMSSRWTLLLAGSHEISTGIGRFNRGAFDDKLRSASRVVPAKNQQYESRLLSEAMPDHENGSCSRGD